MTDIAQVLDVVAMTLGNHMNHQAALPEFQIQRVLFIGKNSGRLISKADVASGKDVPGALVLTMQSGDEYRLTLTRESEVEETMTDQE